MKSRRTPRSRRGRRCCCQARSAWVGFVQLASLVVAVLAIYGTACRIGFARRSAAFGALLFPTLTVVALQAPTALNDLVVAALVVAVAYFTLGRTWSEIGLAGAALALLVGTKPTGLLAVPLLFLVCVLTYRGKRLVAALAVGIAGIGLGATWYAVVTAGSGNGSGVLGDSASASGYGGGVLSIAARTTRYVVETLEVPVEGAILGCTASRRSSSRSAVSRSGDGGSSCSARQR